MKRVLSGLLILAFAACGGGGAPLFPSGSPAGGSIAANANGGRRATWGGNPPHIVKALPTGLVAGSVSLPAGTSLAPSSLTVTNSLGATPVSNSGAYAIPAFISGPQFATVTNKDGNIVLAGFVKRGNATIDARSTAVVMIYFGAQIYALAADARSKAVADIAHASATVALANAISSALASNPNAFASENPAVAQALNTAVQSLAHSTKPSDVVIDPGGAQSGMTALQDFPNAFHLENTYRRRADYFVTQVSCVVNGHTVDENKDYTPGDNEIPPVTGLKGVANTIGDVINGNYAYNPVDTPALSLPLVQGSTSTKYTITVVGAGALDPQVSLTPAQSAALGKVTFKSIVLDFALPMLLSFIIPYSDIDGAITGTGGADVLRDLIGILTSDVPTIADLSAKGNVKGAIEAAFAAIGQSNTLQNAIFQSLQNRIGAQYGFFKAQTFFKHGAAFMSYLKVVDTLSAGFDATVIGVEFASSHTADAFDVTVTGTKVVLSPGSAIVPNSGIQGFVATVPSAAGSDAALQYTWSNTATYGHLTDGHPGHRDNFTSTSNKVTYTAAASGLGTDTIAVTVSAIVGSKRDELGKASASASINQCGATGISEGDFEDSNGGCWSWTGSNNGDVYFFESWETPACFDPSWPQYDSGAEFYLGNINYGVKNNTNEAAVMQTFNVPAGSKQLTFLTFSYGWGNTTLPDLTVTMTDTAGTHTLGKVTSPQYYIYNTFTCLDNPPKVAAFDIAPYAGKTEALRIDGKMTFQPVTFREDPEPLFGISVEHVQTK